MHAQVVSPEQKTLRDLLDGALANEMETQLTDHLSACGRCQEFLESLTSETALDVGRQLKKGRDTGGLSEQPHECRLPANEFFSFVSRSRFLFCLFVAALLLPACGDKSGVGKTVSVSGKVTQGNQPVAGVMVTFVPDKNKGNTSTFVPAGSSQADGTYTLQTNGNSGAPPGAYKVTVTVMPPMSAAQGIAAAPPHLNPKYADATRSDLSIEVKEGAPAGSYDLTLQP